MMRSTDLDPAELFTREQVQSLAQQIQGYMTAKESAISIDSFVWTVTAFALNEVQQASDTMVHRVSFAESFDRQSVSSGTNLMDEASLKGAVAHAEALAKAETVLGAPPTLPDPLRPAPTVNPLLWADASFALVSPSARLAAVETSLRAMERAGLVGAGRVETYPMTLGVLTHAGHFEYGRSSTCEFSVTARTKDNTGSGWAAWKGDDWSKVDTETLTARAIDLAERSKNPVAVEPGRWLVVMTAEALGELVQHIGFESRAADGGDSPFSKPGGGNKLGMKVLDERVTLSADPMDPQGGFLPFDYAGGLRLQQYVPVTWIERGVLKTLSYPTRDQASQHGLDQVNNAGSLRMSGGSTSIEEMIATTKRGIYVTRFSNVSTVVPRTLYLSGVTRDGTFLIENGKITKPVKNMRFMDSPFFFLNNLEALGPVKSVAVGPPSYKFVMPCVKVRDFAFTSLTDAV